MVRALGKILGARLLGRILDPAARFKGAHIIFIDTPTSGTHRSALLWRICLLLFAAVIAADVSVKEFAYVANSLSGSVSVIDTKAHAVVQTIPVGAQPVGVVASRDGKHVYVANRVDNTVSVIDTRINTTVAVIPGLSNPIWMALSPKSDRLYVTNGDNGTVSTIDTLTNTVVDTISVGTNSFGIALTPDGKRAYVTNAEAGTVSSIDLRTRSVRTMVAGDKALGVAVTPDGRHAYVVCGAVICVIDTATDLVTATFLATGRPNVDASMIAITPDGGRAYVSAVLFGGARASVSLVSIPANESVVVLGIAPTLPLDVNAGGGIAIARNGRLAYFSASGGASGSYLVVLDTGSNTTVAAIPDVGPGGIALVQSGDEDEDERR